MTNLFLHPPRTGGSSIRRAWELSPEEYKGHEIPEAVGDDVFAYGFTRNPFDRVVSLYHYPPAAPDPATSFEDFVETRGAAHAHRWSLPVETMAAPTYDWLKYANCVGRYENRAHDLAALAKILGRPVPTLHIGPSRRSDYRDYYTPRLRDQVRAWFEIDFQAFGY